MPAARRKACALRDLGADTTTPSSSNRRLRVKRVYARLRRAMAPCRMCPRAESVSAGGRAHLPPTWRSCRQAGPRSARRSRGAAEGWQAARRCERKRCIAQTATVRADDRLLVRGPVWQKPTNQLGRGGKDRRRLPSHEFAKDRTRLECFPAEDAHIVAELVARGHRPQLPAHKPPQRRFAREGIGVLRRIVILHQRAQCCLQNRAIKPFLAAEMVIDRGLVDVRLGDDGSDAGALVTVACKDVGGRFDDFVPRGLRDSGHLCWPRHADSQNSNDRLNIAGGGRPDKTARVQPEGLHCQYSQEDFATPILCEAIRKALIPAAMVSNRGTVQRLD